jgi:hypothetical protein
MFMTRTAVALPQREFSGSKSADPFAARHSGIPSAGDIVGAGEGRLCEPHGMNEFLC